jgi:hypothetical protein
MSILECIWFSVTSLHCILKGSGLSIIAIKYKNKFNIHVVVIFLSTIEENTDRHRQTDRQTDRQIERLGPRKEKFLDLHLPPDVNFVSSPNVPLFLSSRQAILNYGILKFDAVQFG